MGGDRVGGGRGQNRGKGREEKQVIKSKGEGMRKEGDERDGTRG